MESKSNLEKHYNRVLAHYFDFQVKNDSPNKNSLVRNNKELIWQLGKIEHWQLIQERLNTLNILIFCGTMTGIT